MATLNNAARSVFANALDAWNGGELRLLDSSQNVLAEITLPATAWGAASAGVKEKSGTWQGVGTAAAGAGTQCTAALLVSSGGAQITLTASAAGGSGEVQISNNIPDTNDDIIIEGNAVVVTAATYTHPSGA
jgi:hypothetical protein